MLTKTEMEEIWNKKEIGILKRNFCSRKKIKKFSVDYSVIVTKRVDTKKFSDTIIASTKNHARNSPEISKRIKSLRTKYEKEYPDHLVSVSVIVGNEVN